MQSKIPNIFAFPHQPLLSFVWKDCMLNINSNCYILSPKMPLKCQLKCHKLTLKGYKQYLLHSNDQ
jgi:hypothetical protein